MLRPGLASLYAACALSASSARRVKGWVDVRETHTVRVYVVIIMVCVSMAKSILKSFICHTLLQALCLAMQQLMTRIAMSIITSHYSLT